MLEEGVHLVGEGLYNYAQVVVILISKLDGLLQLLQRGLGLPLPLFSELPRAFILGYSRAYARIPMRYQGVRKRTCPLGFLEEFFSETRVLVGFYGS